MPILHLTTHIYAPIQIVFDLSRSINLHKVSMVSTNEQAIAGTTNGLIQLGETVTWKAKHLFKTRKLTTKIILMQPYNLFIDEMIKGDFKMMKHEHHFKQQGNITIMQDIFKFESPRGFIGTLVNQLFLTKYMKRLLESRNNIIKQFAETGKWKQF